MRRRAGGRAAYGTTTRHHSEARRSRSASVRQNQSEDERKRRHSESRRRKKERKSYYENIPTTEENLRWARIQARQPVSKAGFREREEQRMADIREQYAREPKPRPEEPRVRSPYKPRTESPRRRERTKSKSKSKSRGYSIPGESPGPSPPPPQVLRSVSPYRSPSGAVAPHSRLSAEPSLPEEPEEDVAMYEQQQVRAAKPAYHQRLQKPESRHEEAWPGSGSMPGAVRSVSASARQASATDRFAGVLRSRSYSDIPRDPTRIAQFRQRVGPRIEPSAHGPDGGRMVSLSREPIDVPKRSLSALSVQSGGRGAKRGKSNTGEPVDDHWRKRLPGAPTMAEAPYDMRRALHTQASELGPPPRDRSDLSILQRAAPNAPERGYPPKRRRGLQPLPVLTREDVARRTRSPRGHLDPKKHAEFVKERHPGLKLHKLSKQESEEERARFVKKAERRYLRHIAQDLATGDLTPAEAARQREYGHPSYRDPTRTEIQESKAQRRERKTSEAKLKRDTEFWAKNDPRGNMARAERASRHQQEQRARRDEARVAEEAMPFAPLSPKGTVVPRRRKLVHKKLKKVSRSTLLAAGQLSPAAEREPGALVSPPVSPRKKVSKSIRLAYDLRDVPPEEAPGAPVPAQEVGREGAGDKKRKRGGAEEPEGKEIKKQKQPPQQGVEGLSFSEQLDKDKAEMDARHARIYAAKDADVKRQLRTIHADRFGEQDRAHALLRDVDRLHHAQEVIWRTQMQRGQYQQQQQQHQHQQQMGAVFMRHGRLQHQIQLIQSQRSHDQRLLQAQQGAANSGFHFPRATSQPQAVPPVAAAVQPQRGASMPARASHPWITAKGEEKSDLAGGKAEEQQVGMPPAGGGCSFYAGESSRACGAASRTIQTETTRVRLSTVKTTRPSAGG